MLLLPVIGIARPRMRVTTAAAGRMRCGRLLLQLRGGPMVPMVVVVMVLLMMVRMMVGRLRTAAAAAMVLLGMFATLRTAVRFMHLVPLVSLLLLRLLLWRFDLQRIAGILAIIFHAVFGFQFTHNNREREEKRKQREGGIDVLPDQLGGGAYACAPLALAQ